MKYETFQKNLKAISDKVEHEVLLCVDLYVHNDILFCQNEAREKLFRKMKTEYEKYTM